MQVDSLLGVAQKNPVNRRSTCSGTAVSLFPMSARRKQLVFLWEGAGWADLHPLIDAGKMPHLERLTEGGAMGNLHGVSSPGVSGVVSLASGQAPCDHGVFHDLKAVSPHLPAVEVTRSDWRPVWDQLAANGKRCLEIGWPLTHPATDQLAGSISDRFSWPARTQQYRFCLPKDSVVVSSEFEDSIRRCRVVSSELGLEDLEDLLGIGDGTDPGRVERLKMALASIQSVHAAALVLMKKVEWDLCAMGFDGLRRLFEVSCRHGVPFEERGRLYELLDRMLGEILEKAPADVVVHLVSASSFRKGASDRWFPSDEGIWVMSGAGVVPDTLIHGGHVFDVAPTICALGGESSGEGMRHSPRLDLLVDRPLVSSGVEGGKSSDGQVKRSRPWDQLLRDGRTLHVATPRQLQDPRIAAGLYYDRHLGELQSLIEMGEKERAFIKGRELCLIFPGDFRVGLAYAGCLLEKGRWTELSDLHGKLAKVPHSAANAVELDLLRCALWQHRGRQEEVVNRLALLGKEHNLSSEQWMKVAAFHRRMKRFDQALVIYRGLTKRDPSWPLPWHMMAGTLERQGNLPDAETVARHLISLNGSFESAHLVLARILFRLGRKEEAVDVVKRFHRSGRGSRRSRRMGRFYEESSRGGV